MFEEENLGYVRPVYEHHRTIIRYQNTLKQLLPFRKGKNIENVSGVDEAGWFSFISFTWLSKYITKSYEEGLHVNDIPQISPRDDCDLNYQRLEYLWNLELKQNGEQAKLSNTVWRFVRTRIYLTCITYIITIFLGFLAPMVFMRLILAYSEDETIPVTEGLLWAFCLSLSEVLRTLFFSWTWALNFRTAIRLRSACLTFLYKKLLTLRSSDQINVGKLINMFGSDGQRILDVVLFGPMIFGGPLVTICGAIYIYYLMSGWALIGLATFILFYPIQYGISRLTGYYRRLAVKVTDKRISLIGQILSTIKFLKMYSWEEPFSKELLGIRKEEQKHLKKTTYCQSLSISISPTVPVIASILTFLGHVMAGYNLTSAQAFPVFTFFSKQAQVALSYLYTCSVRFQEGTVAIVRLQVFPIITLLNTQIRNSLNVIQIGLAFIIESRITLKRIEKVLLLAEYNKSLSSSDAEDLAINIEKATYQFYANSENIEKIHTESEEKQPLSTEKEEEVLTGIDLQISKGKILGICGQVGSGKTALLAALTGKLYQSHGNVKVAGSVAYVPQTSWLFNGTLRENILLGESFDSRRYFKTLHSCCLNQDIENLPLGDETLVGERGATLSGGQKQRVALARAVYSNREIFLLDDPLSAVDVVVAQHIVENCFTGALKGKTIIVVAHQTQILSICDEIIVLNKGQISLQGSHKELMKNQMYSTLVTGSRNEEEQQTSRRNSKIEDLDSAQPNSEEGKTAVKVHTKKISNTLLQDALNHGKPIETDTYLTYIKASGGYIVAFLVLLSFGINIGSTSFSSYWLALWIKAGSGNANSTNINENKDFNFYQNIYASTIAVILVTSFIRGFIYTRSTIKASGRIHNNLFSKIMTSPMSFFDITPNGEIQNLFSKDMDEVDVRLPITMETIIQNFWVVIFAVMIIIWVFPWFTIPMIVVFYMYYKISKIFRVAVRDLKRMENSTRAPIFNFVEATFSGLDVIQIFDKQEYFFNHFVKLFNGNASCLYLCCVTMRWLAIRVDIIIVIITTVTAVMTVCLRGAVSPALCGLALSYAAHMSGIFQYTIRLISDIETKFISVENIHKSCKILQSEESTKIPPIVPIPINWPISGEISFQKVIMRYRDGLPDVIKDVSFDVKRGEKIGIVGRTGSGKSSIANCLFRLTEIQSGKIIIDGLDIAGVPLHELRKRISIIPQEPALFSGTIRWNLDPEYKKTDDDIRTAISKTRLNNRFRQMKDGLSTMIGPNGESLSVGEKQLLCLARALLRNSTILILDEATASIDPQTEIDVQQAIQNNFQQCTILTIAHRLDTIINCDRILVLESGRILEFEKPTVLLQDQNSAFYKLINTH